MNSSALREKIRVLNADYAAATGTPHYTSEGGVVLYPKGLNIFHESLKDIRRVCTWHKRLEKSHPGSTSSLPDFHSETARELDSSNSSDALLMSIFCHSTTRESRRIARLLGLDTAPFDVEFGWKAHVELDGGRDRTEIDMVLGDEVFVEAKLTETDFQSITPDKVDRYKKFEDMFNARFLISPRGTFVPVYQVVRNILAAHQHDKRLVFIVHAGRTDLINLILRTCTAIRYPNPPSISLVTWQDIASEVKHLGLREFLKLRYGI